MIIKRKYCSNLYLEQKEYGILDPIKKRIKKSLIKGSNYYRNKYKMVSEELDQLDKNSIENKSLANKLIREADKRNIKVVDENKFKDLIRGGEDTLEKPSEATINQFKFFKQNPKILEENINTSFPNNSKENNKIIKRELLKVMNKVATGKPIVALSQKYTKGSNILAHEIGHEISRNSTGRMKKVSKKVDELEKLGDENLGIRDSLKMKRLKIKNENNANKNGEKVLKDINASKEELRQYKKYRKKALDTYKFAENSKILGKLSNKINS